MVTTLVADYVLAVDGDDLDVFRTAAEAFRAIEATDALDGATAFIAGDGRILKAVADSTSPDGWSLDDAGTATRADVELILRGYMAAVDLTDFNVVDLDTGGLLALVSGLQAKGRVR